MRLAMQFKAFTAWMIISRKLELRMQITNRQFRQNIVTQR
tara:strand:+ start:2005 stop:2124 length:120 start_codon:yes stop_codon:yes gene_type:complete